MTAMFMTAVDIQIVNVALPTLSRAFHVGIASVQWTVVGYVLSLALLIPASGWIGDRFGTRRTYLIALATFTAASALCGSAQSLGELIAARVLQGVGGGMLLPVATAMLFRAYPPEHRARVMRIVIAPILLGPALAPIIGGLFTQDASWRWVFFVNVPVGVCVLAFCGARLTEYRGERTGSFDWIGFVLGGGGLSLVLYAVSEGSVRGWGSPAIVVCAGLGVLALALFVWRECRCAEPVLNLRLLHDRLFRATNIVGFFITGTFLGVLYLTPTFLQEAQHRSPITSGVTTFPEAIGVAVGALTLGRLYPRLGPRVMATVGAAALSVLVLTFRLESASTSLWLIRGQMFLIGLAVSTAFIPLQTAMFTKISTADTGHASAIYNTARQVATAVFTAILSTIVAGVGGSQLSGFHDAYIAAAAGAAFASLAAFTLIHTSDAAPSMVRATARAGA